MNKRTIFTVLSLMIFALSTTVAADLGAVKGAMKKRLPQMEQLWSQGLIGENNEGYVEARGSLTAEQQKLVTAENSDREIVYEAIAKSTQTTPEQVGKQRAAQISQRAAKGLWLQDADGDWYKK